MPARASGSSGLPDHLITSLISNLPFSSSAGAGSTSVFCGGMSRVRVSGCPRVWQDLNCVSFMPGGLKVWQGYCMSRKSLKLKDVFATEGSNAQCWSPTQKPPRPPPSDSARSHRQEQDAIQCCDDCPSPYQCNAECIGDSQTFDPRRSKSRLRRLLPDEVYSPPSASTTFHVPTFDVRHLSLRSKGTAASFERRRTQTKVKDAAFDTFHQHHQAQHSLGDQTMCETISTC